MNNEQPVDTIIPIKAMIALPIIIDNNVECNASIDGSLITAVIEESPLRTRIYLSGTKDYFVTTLEFDALLDTLNNLNNSLFYCEVEAGEAFPVKLRSGEFNPVNLQK